MRGDRKNGYPRDAVCADGVMDYGWRKVRKGGVVKAYGSYWQDDRLIPFIGDYVVVNSTDYHCVVVEVFKTYPTMSYRDLICKIGDDR
jgi:hypothetical protein